jgi:hypothetical protein
MERLGKNDPQLIAELSAFSAADALQWAESSLLTGRLTFRSEGAKITLDLEQGGIVFACSNRSLEGLGRHLFAEGLVDEVDLAAALVYSRDNQRRIGASMVELEVLSALEVSEALFHHNVNLTTLPVPWQDGWVSAETGAVPERDGLAPEPASARMILMEAARRTDELKAIHQVIPNDDVVLALEKSTARNVAPPDAFAGRWRRILETHEPGASVGSHYERVGGCRFSFLEALQALLEAGAFTLEEASASRAGESSSSMLLAL